ncbi:hypothetical protein EVJ58_g9194 [Rhodofomes roseus]|uniref:Uncharacterized protein n=1 Tax=Rhodofomes roseus TaxID=34475 RepID=A0A4Y9XUR9_9APHY|nr:hypothetical protein EVJ58_g9194 [Rhodofomes roseus]
MPGRRHHPGHHGPHGAYPRHGSPPPPGDEGLASSAPEGAQRGHGRHHREPGSPRRYVHRYHGPQPPAPPQVPGEFFPIDPEARGAILLPPGPPPAHEEFVHIPPLHTEDVPRSPGAAPPPPPQGEDHPRSPGAPDERERRRRHGPGRRHHNHGPPQTPFDAFFGGGWGTDFNRMFGLNPAQPGAGFVPGGPEPWAGREGGARWGQPPHARASRAFWGPEESSGSSEEA